MSNFALANDFSSHDRWGAAAQRRKLTTVTVPWKDVVLSRVGDLPAQGGPSRWLVPAAIAVLAISIHAGVAWYASHHAADAKVPPRKHEVEVQLVEPPKPLPPKVEPPKPPPPKPQVKRQTLPQIQTAVPDVPAVSSAPAEAPVSVAPVSEPPAPPPEPEVVTAPFGRAGYLNNPPPQYPNLAEPNGGQGTVLLKVRVLSTGRVDEVEVQKSSGFKLLDEEAKATVRTWQFSPSKRGATPIDGWATVPIEFKLDT